MIFRALIIFMMLNAVAFNAQSQNQMETDNNTVASSDVEEKKTSKESKKESSNKKQNNEDFKPKEEISEDFPVSLPSDI